MSPKATSILAYLVSAALQASRGALYQAGSGRHAFTSTVPPVVSITAREYTFDGPASIESGPTTFRLVSRGREQHFLGIVKIAPPHTLADYRRVLTAQPQPPWVTSVGGVGTLSPGGIATTTLDLEPGLYAMLCDMPDPHGVPHMLKGMLRPLTVLRRRNAATMPTPDVEIDLTDFAFVSPVEVRAGARVIGVRNIGTQPHMALVWRVAAGSSAASVVHWIDTPSDTSHPVTLMGGVPDLAPGRAAQLVVRLEPGRYVLICVVEDPHDHVPHYRKGMIKEITVVG